MPGIDIRLNAQNYLLKPREDGSKILTRPVEQFVQSIKDTGRTRPEDVSPYETFIHPDLTHGFGRYRINSDRAFDPNEYKRFWDSTLDTRWPDAIYLPILSQNSVQTGLNVVKCSTSFKGEINSLWSTAAETGTSRGVANRQFTGDVNGDGVVDSGDHEWENGGYLQAPGVRNLGAGADLVTYNKALPIPEGTDLLVVVVAYTDNALSNVLIQFGYNAASNGSSRTDMTELYNAIDTTNDIGIGIFYTVSPTIADDKYFTVRMDSGTAVSEINAVAYTIHGADTAAISAATANSADTSGTAVSTSLTTAVGDFVVDVVAGNENIGMTSGSNQSSGMAATGASIAHSHKSSYKNATTTSTTMSHTMASSISGGILHAVGAFAMLPQVPVDITSDSGNLVAMTVISDDHRISTSTTGASWTESTTPVTKGLLASDRGADFSTTTPVDAGLFATIGGELIACLWDEDSSSITFFNSTNGGVAWTDESVDIPSSNGPQGVAVYVGIDGEDKLYVATHEGIYEVDTSPSTWTFQLIVPMSNSNDNGRRMTVHSGSLWFAQGVDNDSPVPIYRMTVQGNSRIIQSGYGLDVGDGVPDDMLGPVRFMKSTGDQLFISVGGGAADRKARILSWSNTGWHHMTRNTTANQRIDWLDVGSGDDGVPRLHYSMRTAVSTCDAEFLAQPLVNPRSGVSIKREDDVKSGDPVVFTTGYVDLPYIDLGMPHENKNFLRTHVNGEDLNSSAADEYISIQYGTDDDARTTNVLGDFTSATTVNSFASNAGVSAKNIGMRVNFLRGSTNTATPKLKDLIVEGMIVPGNGNLSYQHEITIDIDQTATATGLSTESVYSNLKTLLATVTQVDFEFGAESRKVTVDRDNSAFLTYLDEYGYASSPNSMASRSGILRLVLVERIPLS